MSPKMPRHGFKEARKVYERLGYKHARTNGSHWVFEKDDGGAALVLVKTDDLSPWVIRDCYTSAGLTRDEYIKLLTKKKK